MAAARPAATTPPAPVLPAAASWFASAAACLHRPDLRCPEHRVAHTGKLARAVVLDLALLDGTGDDRYWARAVERARWVASKLAPDPEHGGYIYLPGRFDPRNCSNSVIDSGECTDALARLLAHERAAALPAAERDALHDAVTRNAETYLCAAAVEKETTNQRLWGAMGLASAHALAPHDRWSEAIAASVARSLAEQLPDGAWGYLPEAERHGVFRGAGDVSPYYQGRCLAFLLHIVERVPEADAGGAASAAIERGLEFLAATTTPDGLKPLALEGKRWFWDGSYEAGSNAYDLYALIRGAERFGRPEWRALAARAWRQLERHLGPGGVLACADAGAADFVCRDFHTADLAWTAQVMRALGTGGAPAAGDEAGTARRQAAPAATHGPAPSEAPASPGQTDRPDGPTVRQWPAAGLLRLEAADLAVLIRTGKQPSNSLFGGAVGGGALAAVVTAAGEPRLRVERERTLVEANFVLLPRWSVRATVAAARRWLDDNRPGREGRQWLFVARLLLARGRPVTAAARLWRGYLRPALAALRDPAASQWAVGTTVTEDDDRGAGAVLIEARPARRDGTVPSWAARSRLRRRYSLAAGGLLVEDELTGAAAGGHDRLARVAYRLPAAAREVAVDVEGARRWRRAGTSIVADVGPAPFTLRVAFRL